MKNVLLGLTFFAFAFSAQANPASIDDARMAVTESLSFGQLNQRTENLSVNMKVRQ